MVSQPYFIGNETGAHTSLEEGKGDKRVFLGPGNGEHLREVARCYKKGWESLEECCLLQPHSKNSQGLHP